MQAHRSVLIVEDESIMVMLLELKIRAAGFSICDAVGSKDEAVSSAIEYSPDIVIMDIRLNGNSDGIEAAAEIIKKIKTQIIFTTGYSDPETIQRAQQVKPLAYLVKPFEMSELISIMKKNEDGLGS
jgi:AmiR/NasT family two-component response regulator